MEEKGKYRNGKIYAIRSHKTNKIYIGSTCSSLSKRLYGHRHREGKYVHSSKILIDFDDHYVELMESFPCNSKEELCKREGELIRENREICVNIFIPGRTRKDRDKENGGAYYKKYAQSEKGKIVRKRKEENYRLKHSNIVKCECGSEYLAYGRYQHLKTKKHTNYIKECTPPSHIVQTSDNVC